MLHNAKLVNEMVYLLDEEDGTSAYAMYLNGEPVFYLYANKNVFDLPIYVSKPEFDAPRTKLEGVRAFLVEDMSRINGNSMKAVAYKNLAWIVAGLYAPKQD